MELLDTDKIASIKAMTRFHFIAGLPRSGASVLTALLRQNPRFVTTDTGPAQPVFDQMTQLILDGKMGATAMDEAQTQAMLRGVLQAMHHARPPGSVVFDNNANWLHHPEQLAALFPLSRFIICVRNPAGIANSIELSAPDGQSDADQAARLRALFETEGDVGHAMALLRKVLRGAETERMLVIDYDRMVDDPEDVMDVLYEFLREPEFNHDFKHLTHEAPVNPASRLVEGPVRRTEEGMSLSPRVVRQLSGRAFWRNLRRTQATMILGRAR